jgi:thiol-disulfide isomerase/thioredoxin
MACAEKKKEVFAENVTESIELDNEVTNVLENQRVPSYNFDELNTLLTKNNDTTYVVNFWATWCRPCIKELPAFEKLNADYSDKPVKVLLVSLDFPDKIEKQVIPFMDKNNIKSKVVLLDDPDANSWIPKVSEKWSGAIPATIIYKGQSREFYERSFTFEELNTELHKFL